FNIIMMRERISRSTRIVHGLVLYSYPPQATTLWPSRRSAACIIAMSVEPRKMGEVALGCMSPTLNRVKLNFEQGQVPVVPAASRMIASQDAAVGARPGEQSRRSVRQYC